MRNQLSEKQRAIYRFISRYQATNDGRAPTIYEIRQAFGYRSDNMVLKHINALKVHGMITSFPSDSHRSIRPTLDAKRALIQLWSRELFMPEDQRVEEIPYITNQRDAFLPSEVSIDTINEEKQVGIDAILPTDIDTEEYL